MTPIALATDPDDVAYVRRDYLTLPMLAQLRGASLSQLESWSGVTLPAATYQLADGSRWYAADWWRLWDDAGAPEQIAGLFQRRYLAAAAALGQPATAALVDDAWRAYTDGLYGACLREVTPEAIVAKLRLVSRIEEALAEPNRESDAWAAALRADVEALDGLERPFAACDRPRFGRPTSRDRLIADVRRLFPRVFAG